MNFVSQDYLVEKIIKMPIKEYLNKHGHLKLKKFFDNILKELIMICSNTIIDCGGAVSHNID
jgi:shikimate kinase